MKVLQVVGFQNSGKTTLVTKLIHKLTEEGIKVGTIKHHGHGGKPAIGDQGKDTGLHRKAGASVVAVEGEGTIHLTADASLTLDNMLALYEMLFVDIVLVEGYKNERYPKVVLLRDKEDLKLIKDLSNIEAVISVESLGELKYPYFTRKEEAAYLTYLMNAVRGQ
ncbi:molybdopterin-guanine dinucleotide biosynthesis protein B [Bacillus sp. RD4P76]|uniref:Molybdopterin-guanine dinucleotide biosynthesis protein B n=1 Tax=Bacillus suaedaesalsae TaxID=2810349 RepID=A0ABS2DK16_9BACI|nr:molybdopterin-guanine dinucleotide biosynthesis protein B [Bacillus suaedaesalsae]